MDFIQRQIRYIKDGKILQDQFYLDEDINIPDSKADVNQIVCGNGVVKVENLQVVENYLKITGKLFYQVLYMTGYEEAEGLEGSCSFEEMIYLEEEKAEQYYVENIRTDFAATLIHSRKVNIRTQIELTIGCETLMEENTTLDIEAPIQLFKKKQDMTLLELYTTKKDTYRIKEEITLSGSKDSVGQLLFSKVDGRKLEIRTEQNAVSLKGELQVFAVYLSENGKIEWMEQTVPYFGEIQCEGVNDEMYVHAQQLLEDTFVELRMDEDGEMRVLGIEGTINLRMNLYQEEQMELLEDLYSLEQNCSFDTVNVEYEELVLQNHSKYKMVERLEVPELKGCVEQICYSDGEIQVHSVKAVENGLKIEGFLFMECLYQCENGETTFGSWKGKIPFATQVDCPKMPVDMKYNLTSFVEQLTVNFLSGDVLDIKAVLAFDAFIRKGVSMKTIENIELVPLSAEEIEQRPGMVGYIVKEGDCLWDLAKHYKTTEEQIRKINNLETDVLKSGDKLIVTGVDS